MIKNVIFDIGNTLLSFDELSFLTSRYSNKAVVEALRKTMFQSPEWNMLDCGILSISEALQIFYSKQPQLKQEISDTMRDWLGSLVPINESIKLLRELKSKNYKIYFLSNFYEEGFYYMKNKFPILNESDGYLISYQVKLMKPNIKIYKMFLEKFDLKPKECFFLDDLEENLEGARKVGIQGMVFEDANKVWNYIEKVNSMDNS